MAEASTEPSGPDLAEGVALADLADGGKLVGHAGGKPILLVRSGNEVFAVGAQCTHYNGPLGDGLVVGNTVRCPWHHACFDLRTGEALRAPALSPVACWRVEQQDGKIFVREKLKQQKPEPRGKSPASAPDRIVIVGGGAAGFAAAEMLRRDAFPGKHRHAERRRCASRRPAEPVQGLPRRKCGGGLGPAAARELLCRERYRSAAQDEGHRHRCAGAEGSARGREHGCLRPLAAGNWRRAGPSHDSRRRPAARAHAPLARRLQGDHRQCQDGAHCGGHGCELYRA